MDSLWRRLLRAVEDNSFGPVFPGHFDFTLKFEDIIFTILPNSLFLLLAPIYILYYARRPLVDSQDPLLWLKFSCSGALLVLEVVTAAFCISPEDATGSTKGASVMACLAAAAIMALLHYEHRHAVQSSPLPSLYLVVTLLLDFAKARSYFLRSESGFYNLACLTVAVATTKLLLAVLEEVPRQHRHSLEPPGKEASRGFWGRTLFVWVNSTLLFGFRNRLSADDLPDLDPGFASAKLASAFWPTWIQHKTRSLWLLIVTIWTLLGSFLAVVPPRLLCIAFSYTQPFLIREILLYVEAEEKSEDYRNGLIGAMALAHIGETFCRVWYNHMNNILATKARGTLVSQILRKNMVLSHESAKEFSASTLMSTDVDSILRLLPKVHEAWAGLVQLGVGVYLLSLLLRQASFLVVIPALVNAVISFEIGRRSRLAASAWNEKVEERVSKTSKILAQIRGIKMIASEHAVADYIQRLRDVEIRHSKKSRWLDVVAHSTAPIGYTFTPILVIAGGLYWDGFSDGFNATEAFTTLAFVFLASQPMMTILTSWSRLGSLIACFGRVQDYLMLEERFDYRNGAHQRYDRKSLDFAGSEQKQSSYHIRSGRAMEFDDLSVLYKSGKQPLYRATAAIIRDAITMIIGPTGTGKSTVLKALLGESIVVTGSVNFLSQPIAYCDQNVWMCNVTIRECIIGENDYNEAWYNRIVAVCLLRDIFALPFGDLSLAGSNGSNLSGGQKQRIALARALYSRASILLLDDVFSALDSSTASSILGNLCGKKGQVGLLRSIGATVVMTTHTVEHLKYADRALMLHRNGTITAVTPKTARSRAKEYGSPDFIPSEDEESTSDGGSLELSPPRQYKPADPKPEISTKFRQKGDTALYAYYMRSVGIFVLLLWLFVTAVVAVTERMPDIFVRIWVEKDPDNKQYFLGYALVGVGGVVSVAVWTWLYFIRLVPESSGRLHRVLLDSVTEASLSFLAYTDSGSLLNRFSQDMSLLSQELPMSFLFFLYTFFTVLTNLAILSAAARNAAALLPVILLFLFVLQLYYLRTSRQIRLLDLEAKTPLYTHVTETSEGLQHIRAFGWEERYLAKGQKLLDASQKPVYYLYCIQRWLSLVLDLTVTGVTVTLLALALDLDSTKQAALGLGLLNTMQMGPELTDLIDTWIELETSLGALSRLRTFTSETPREGQTGAAGTDGDADVPENWPSRGEVEFDDVSSEYTTTDSNHKALNSVSTVIPGGTKVGIVGRTGSGKTSLFLTLLNFLKFTGSIHIDGIDISTIPRRLLRSRVTIISQDFMELPSSIRDNLLPHDMNKSAENRAYDDASLLAVLQRVGLGEHINTTGSLDLPVEEIGLSSGQKQLLALARALLHNQQTRSKLVLIDEASSNVDYDVEEKMQAIMTEQFETCTVLTIAHRHNTLQAAEILLELSGGFLLADS